MRRQRGVTIPELMIALIVSALLASIAIPSYSAIIERTRVGQAINDLGRLSAQIERWRTMRFDFPETLADAGINPGMDPWGNPYRYLKIATANTGQVRRDRNLRPINSDFDLYSMGKDGDTQTQLQAQKARDDIVRASDGNFFGIAKDY
jgi:general secretion pathway protein G